MIRIVDWNINGGHLIKDGLTKKDFNFFLNKIKKLNPDILLIQEGHISKDYSQVEIFSKELGLKYYTYQELGESHIEKGNQLCLFVLSKFEITNSDFYESINPNLVSFNEKYGGEIKSEFFKKGFLKTEMKINNKKVNVISGHLHPLHIFKKSHSDFPEIMDEARNYILSQGENENMILGSDLNYEFVVNSFSNVFEKGIKLAFDEVTTYKNMQLDYVMLSKSYTILEKNVDLCTEDHALIYVDIDEK